MSLDTEMPRQSGSAIKNTKNPDLMSERIDEEKLFFIKLVI